MPLPDKNDPKCVGKTIRAEVNSGKSKKQASAIALSYCEKKNEVEKLKSDIQNELDNFMEYKKIMRELNAEHRI